MTDRNRWHLGIWQAQVIFSKAHKAITKIWSGLQSLFGILQKLMYCTHTCTANWPHPPPYTVAPDQFNALSSLQNEAVSSLPLVKCAPFSFNTAMATVWQHPSMQTTALCISALCHFQRHLVHQLLTRAAYSKPLPLSKASPDFSENRKALKLGNFDILENFKMVPSRSDLQKQKGIHKGWDWDCR